MRYTFLLLFIVLSSCKAQEKEATKPKQTEGFDILQTDKDPYFEGTNKDTSHIGPRTITRNILQDRNGSYWLATWDGIIGYDGEIFTNFTNKEKLRRYRVFTILEDREGMLWFGTIGAGVYKYDGKTFTNLTTKEGLVDDRVADIFEDKDGFLWFATLNGISKYDGKAFTNFRESETGNNNDVNCIIQGDDGLYYIGTRGEAFTFNGQEFTVIKHPDGHSFNNVRKLIKDDNGQLWLGGNDGLWTFDRGKWSQVSDKFTGYIYEDSEGNLWTSSSSDNPQVWDLSKYDQKYVSKKEVVKTEAGMYFGIEENEDGKILLGTLDGVYMQTVSGFTKL